MRNRVVGDGLAYGNLELRGQVLRTQLLKQNFYIALAALLDGGMVTQKYLLPANLLIDFPEAAEYIDPNTKEVPHLGYGAGLHLALNRNFIVTVDYGWAVKDTDGTGGNMYVNMNFLF